MASAAAVGVYVAILLGLLFMAVYLLLSHEHAGQTGGPSSDSAESPFLNRFVPSRSAAPKIAHHPIAEHANILSTPLFNSFNMPNQLFSPLGIAYALAIVQAAAEGATAEELERVLGGKYTMDELREILGTFRQQSSNTMSIVTYWSVNSSRPLNQAFVKETAGLCTISSDNYADDQLRTIHSINKFFADNTKNHINSAARAIRPATSSVLINTLFFQTYWSTPFDPRMTSTGNFTQFVGTVKPVPMMRTTDTFPYFNGPQYQLVEMPFNSSEYTMGFLLVHLPESSNPVRHVLDLRNLMADISRLQPEMVQIHLPRFKHKRMIRTHVNLRNLNVTAVFNPKRAELPRLGEGIHLTEMIHEAMMHVDELGSNTDRSLYAAYQKGGQAGRMARNNPKKTVREVAFDRTFVYYVRHTATNTFLMIGEYDLQ